MIADWREKMSLDLPFFFVQLAPPNPGCDDEPTCKKPGTGYALIRQAQMCALKLPSTGYAIALDIGDPKSPHGSIHPRRKQEVGSA
jgi:sialate O-acetylesterase